MGRQREAWSSKRILAPAPSNSTHQQPKIIFGFRSVCLAAFLLREWYKQNFSSHATFSISTSSTSLCPRSTATRRPGCAGPPPVPASSRATPTRALRRSSRLNPSPPPTVALPARSQRGAMKFSPWLTMRSAGPTLRASRINGNKRLGRRKPRIRQTSLPFHHTGYVKL